MRVPVLLVIGAGGAAVGVDTVLLAVALLFLSGLFSGAETAIVSARRAKLERLAEEGKRDAKSALHLLSDTPRAIATTLVGTNLSNIAAASLTTAIAVTVWGDRGPALATLILTPVVLFGGEIVPKALFRSRPTQLLRALAGVLQIFSALFRPLVLVATGAVRVLLLLARVPAAEARPVFGRDDLENLFLFGRAGEEDGDAAHTETAFRMAGKALDLSRRSVAEAMAPLGDHRTCLASGSVGETVERFRSSGGKILAALDSSGEVMGFVAAKDILGESPEWPVAPYVRPAHVVPPGMALNEAIAVFRRQKRSVALVRDDAGGTLGVLTPEDVLEEIVGDLSPVHRPGLPRA